MGGGSRSNRPLKRLEDHNTSPEREKSVSKARSKKSTSSGPKQADSSRSKDGGRAGGRPDSDSRKECDSKNRTGSDVGRHSHGVPHVSSSSTNSKSKKIEDKNSNGGSKAVGSDKHSTSTLRKRDGEEKSQNGHDSVERERKRSRSCSPENTPTQPHDNAGGKNFWHGSASKKARSSPPRVRWEVSLSATSSSSGSQTSSALSQRGRFKRKRNPSSRLFDGSNSPRWARDKFENLFQCQQLNEERLERIEAGLRKHTALEEKERFSGHLINLRKKCMRISFSSA